MKYLMAVLLFLTSCGDQHETICDKPKQGQQVHCHTDDEG